MFKKLLKAAATFALLVGCYFGYVHGFERLVEHQRKTHPGDEIFFPVRNSRSRETADALARETLGPEHWSSTNDQPFAYYNAERGFWMYTLDVKEIQEENGVRYDGKRLRMTPFLLIWKSSDGKSTQVLTGETAILDMNQPVGLSSKQGTEALKVKHARVEGDVRIRDDRGTPRNLADDMNIGPLTYVEFDEAKQQITTESHVVIVDPDTRVTCIGMDIQLRMRDPNAPPGRSATGFEGAETAILKRKVHVVMRDVGNSGVLPGPAPSRKARGKPREKPVELRAELGRGGPDPKNAGPAAPEEPTPLDIRSDGPMRIDMARSPAPVEVGPPEPPPPTKVQFDRNVVALHGHADRQPNQLDCDTLRLTLIPAEKPQPGRKAAGGSNPAPASAPGPGSSRVASSPAPAGRSSPAPSPTVARDVPRRDGDGPQARPLATSEPDRTDGASQGLFGNLTLQKAHATGHAVWLQLREQGVRVRCNELIHKRQAPYHPDLTYFRGDLTRRIWLEKVDRAPLEPDGKPDPEATAGTEAARPDRPRQGKVTSVTHVVTVDATLQDKGGGLDLADVVARGPGRLEARPDLDQPVERIAEWQDELIIVNRLGGDGELQRKEITLTGTRPSFEDKVQRTRLDSGERLVVWLKPKPPAVSPAAAVAPAAGPTIGTARIARSSGPSPGATGATDTAVENPAGAGLGSGGFQIERLLAFRDVHMIAPERRIDAREVLDAPFVEAEVHSQPAEPAAVASTAGSGRAVGPDRIAGNAAESSDPAAVAEAKEFAGGQDELAPSTAVADRVDDPKPPAGPTMTGVADRVWAKVALKPGTSLDARSSPRPRPRPKQATAVSIAAEAPGLASSDAGGPAAEGTSPPSDADDSNAEVREAWLQGNVALHQDPAPPRPGEKPPSAAKGQDITGEAVYLNNRGPGKVLARVYARDPDPRSGPPKPGPIRLAMVADDERTIWGQILRMDQEHDKLWADGPGTLTQWTDRNLLTDKATEPAVPPDGPAGAKGTNSPASAGPAGTSIPAGGGPRLASRSTAPGNPPVAPELMPTPTATSTSKPRTRAGRPVRDKDLINISWTKRMEFTGRTTDPLGRPAGRADFYGVVKAEMEDALLYATERMIAFTDREVPLAQVGSLSRASAKAEDGAGPEDNDGDGEAGDQPKARTQADLALIYCIGEPIAVSRKIDPDAPIVLQKQWIDVFDHQKGSGELHYNRTTGEFYVPGPGMVYLYDRDANSGQTAGLGPGRGGDSRKDSERNPPGNRQTRPDRSASTDPSVTPTSGRPNQRIAGAPSSARTARPPASAGAGNRSATAKAAGQVVARPAPAAGIPPNTRKIPPLVLTQIKFATGMRGRFGAGQANDTQQDRWSEFFGDIEVLRAQVPNDGTVLDADKPLPPDGFYLTSQILRVIQEPPPPGAPAAAPSRNFLKAWDKVTVNKGRESTLQCDVATYDSASDRLYAYGEGNRQVYLVQQSGVGQPASTSQARAVQFNVKTGAASSAGSDVIQFYDRRTGSRPAHVAPPDPNAKPKPKVKPLFKIPNNNLERRGFTGS